ncbi:unnamed protein product [Urochloa humidicola]
MESVNLNSQAGDFPHLNDYESYLRGGTFSVGGSMESALAPNRCNRSLGVHRRDAGWSQRGRGGGGRRGQQLDFGGGRAGSMASAPPGGAFVGPSSSGEAAGARAIAPPGAAGGKMRGTSAYSSRGGASSSGHARSSRGRGRHRGQRMPREDFYYLQEEDEEAENEFEDLYNSRGQDGDSSEDGDEDELPYENDVYASEDGDEDELQYENDEYPSEDEESTPDGRKSSSEDEIIKMARNNLKRDHEFTMQTMTVFGTYFQTYYVKRPRRVPIETGMQWVERTLANDTDCYDMFRVSRPVFNRLHNLLVQSYGLKSGTKMSSIEALAMFLWVVGGAQPVRQARNRLVRSLETVSRNFGRVLTSVLKLADDIIKPKDPQFSTVHPVLENPLFWPYFNDCIGAIDGTHVPVVVPKSKVVAHMCRHKYTSQNVLAICDFDMRFTFVLAGWPGSVHDMTVFKDATLRYAHKFPHPPPGKFYCVDAGYPNRPGYLSPYRGTKYPRAPFKNAPSPKGKTETFNHAHAKVRNVIERSFGVLKMKFRILLRIQKFPIKKQARIIAACMALHNFIRESKLADRDFDPCDADENYVPGGYDNDFEDELELNTQDEEPIIEDTDMNAFRDEIADALFYK